MQETSSTSSVSCIFKKMIVCGLYKRCVHAFCVLSAGGKEFRAILVAVIFEGACDVKGQAVQAGQLFVPQPPALTGRVGQAEAISKLDA